MIACGCYYAGDARHLSPDGGRLPARAGRAGARARGRNELPLYANSFCCVWSPPDLQLILPQFTNEIS